MAPVPGTKAIPPTDDGSIAGSAWEGPHGIMWRLAQPEGLEYWWCKAREAAARAAEEREAAEKVTA